MDQATFAASINKYIQDRLQWLKRLDDESSLSELLSEATEHRIVSGGQDFEDHWTIVDAKTGELLANGRGRDAYEAAMQPHWRDIECVRDLSYELVPEPECDESIPASLVGYLSEWIDDNPEDAKNLLDG